jgi:hypothetical protein
MKFGATAATLSALSDSATRLPPIRQATGSTYRSYIANPRRFTRKD